jgi:hypothetical protein
MFLIGLCFYRNTTSVSESKHQMILLIRWLLCILKESANTLGVEPLPLACSKFIMLKSLDRVSAAQRKLDPTAVLVKKGNAG